MRNIFGVFGFFLALGILLHLLPNWRVPLHSDVTWEPRLEVATDSAILEHIPDWMKLLGTYPQSSLNICRDWYQFTGRFNCLDTLSLKWTAEVAGSNADLWRLIYIIILAVDVALFYLICSKLKISKPINLFVAIGLYFWPVDVWTSHVTAEPRAVLFLLVSCVLVLRSGNIWFSTMSAISMIAAVLTKESFFSVWFVIGALIFWHNRKSKKLFLLVIPHLAALSLVVASFLFISSELPVKTPGYVFSTLVDNFSLLNYLWENLRLFFPIYLANNLLFVIFFLAFFLVAVKLKEVKLPEIRKIIFLCLIFLTAAIIAELPYLLTHRPLLSRYIIPANLLISILLGLILTKYFDAFSRFVPAKKKFGQYLLLWSLALILFLPSLNSLISKSIHDRADAVTWDNLVSKVIKIAPDNSHVVIELEDSSMIEIAYSLEANTLLAKRYDLVFHINLLNKGETGCPSFNCYNVELFNLNRTSVTSEANIVYIKVARQTGNFNYVFSLNQPI